MFEKNNSTRRSVLRKSGISIGMILSGSGLASATNSQSADSNGGIEVEDGKFVLNATPDEISQDTYRLTKAAVGNFNAIIEAGYFRISGPSTQTRLTTQATEQTSLTIAEGTTAADITAVNDVESLDASVSIEQAQEPRNLSTSSVTTQSCNKDDVDVSRQALPPKVDVHLYMSDGTITDISAAAGGGAPAGAVIYKYLVSKGYIAAGALAGPVATAIFAAVSAYWGVVNIKNNGCGVVIKTGVSPIDPLVPTPTVGSQ